MRAPRIADPVRAIATLVAAVCVAVLLGCASGPFFAVTRLSVSGTHHATVDAVSSEAIEERSERVGHLLALACGKP